MQSREEKVAAIRTLLPLVFSHLDCHGSRRAMVARYFSALACSAATSSGKNELELWESIFRMLRSRYRLQDINRALACLLMEEKQLYWAVYYQTLDPWPDWMKGSAEALCKTGIQRLAELVEGDVIGYEPRDDEATLPQLRDREVRRMMADGYSSRRIAASLGTGKKQVLASAKRMGLEWQTPRRNKSVVRCESEGVTGLSVV